MAQPSLLESSTQLTQLVHPSGLAQPGGLCKNEFPILLPHKHTLGWVVKSHIPEGCSVPRGSDLSRKHGDTSDKDRPHLSQLWLCTCLSSGENSLRASILRTRSQETYRRKSKFKILILTLLDFPRALKLSSPETQGWPEQECAH